MLNAFRNYLSSSGIEYSLNDDVISFNRNNLQYIFICENSDPYYFRLILPNVLDTNSNVDKIHRYINNINLTFKAVKLYITENNSVWISIEQFVYSSENITNLFERSITLLELVFNHFRENLNSIGNEND